MHSRIMPIFRAGSAWLSAAPTRYTAQFESLHSGRTHGLGSCGADFRSADPKAASRSKSVVFDRKRNLCTHPTLRAGPHTYRDRRFRISIMRMMSSGGYGKPEAARMSVHEGSYDLLTLFVQLLQLEIKPRNRSSERIAKQLHFSLPVAFTPSALRNTR
jgi:hypothetical protein